MAYVRNRGTKDKPEWYGRFKDVDGKWKQRHTHALSKATALRIVAGWEERVSMGLAGIPEPTPEEQAQKQITLKDLAKRYLDEAAPRAKDPHGYKVQLKSYLKRRVEPYLGDRTVESLKPADVEWLRDKLVTEGYSGVSATHAICAISTVLKWGKKVGLITCEWSIRGLSLPKSIRSLDFLSKEEVARLIDYAQVHAPDAYPAIATAIYAGLRKGEIFGLRWQDVQLEADRIDVLRSYRLLPKSGKPRHLPLHPELARILRQWQKQCPVTGEGLVFPVSGHMGDSGDMLDLPALLAEAGCHVPKKPWHALRHTFGSHFVMNGGSLYVLQRLLGHSTPEMTQIYAHLSPDHLAGEMIRLDFTVPAPAGTVSFQEAQRKRAADGMGH